MVDFTSTGLLALLVIPILTMLDDEGGDEQPSGGRSEIHWLRAIGDRDALFQLLETGKQLTQGLEAAEALVQLGDVRGLDHLIATLNSPSSFLRARAAEILMDLNHPRGLRALQDRRRMPADGAAARQRDRLIDDLDARGTDELVAIWHENDRSQWPDPAFEVLEEILTSRLGKPPSRHDSGGNRGLQDIDENADPRIQHLWRDHDVDGLLRLYESESDVSLQLEAAEALAHLGDADALDVLIEALDDTDPEVSEMAAEILDWLDLPRGNQALEDRGLEFETDARDLLEAAESSPVSSTGAPWSQSLPPPAEDLGRPAVAQLSPAAPVRPAWPQPDAGAITSPALILNGAVGGILGFVVFRLALAVLGWLPWPQDLAGWLQTSTFLYLAISFIIGALSGSPGARVARSVAVRRGYEITEGDLALAAGAFLQGALSALVVDLFLFLVIGR